MALILVIIFPSITAGIVTVLKMRKPAAVTLTAQDVRKAELNMAVGEVKFHWGVTQLAVCSKLFNLNTRTMDTLATDFAAAVQRLETAGKNFTAASQELAAAKAHMATFVGQIVDNVIDADLAGE